jgi:general secretion pathway protein A
MLAPLSFSPEIPVSDMLATPQQSESFARLRYTINSKGFGVITGTPGTGKSSLIRLLESSLDKSRFLLCYINETDLKPKTLYLRLLAALAIIPAAYLDKLKKQFREAILQLYQSQDRLPVIVIDNAQELPVQTLRELRYLIRFDMDSASVLTLILAGHPELWDTLKLRTFEPLRQCVTTHYRITALDEAQTKEYIVHQLKLSDMSMCFPDDVVKRIYQFTSGIPRIINAVCRHCLIDIESNHLDLVDTQVTERVLNEFRN